MKNNSYINKSKKKWFKFINTNYIISISNKISIITTKKSLIIIFIIVFIFYHRYIKGYIKQSVYGSTDNILYDIVIPVYEKDIKKILKYRPLIEKYIKFNKMIIITNDLNNLNDSDKSYSTKFIMEDDLIKKENIKNLFLNMGINETNRTGWYLQQFLKMSYSEICENEYYLLWDSDTLPIRFINMFDKSNPIFDMKKEYHSPYFNTLVRLFPDINFSKLSYISEHMMIKTEYMKDLIKTIENNKNIPGKIYWEKILMAIDRKDIIKSGFSEFETYGSFVDTYYTNTYKHRKWASKRDMTNCYKTFDNVNMRDIEWLSKDYHAITFENWDEFNKNIFDFIKKVNFEDICRPKRFFKYYKRIMKKFCNNKC